MSANASAPLHDIADQAASRVQVLGQFALQRQRLAAQL